MVLGMVSGIAMMDAVLFDLDGLLIDSESLHFACWRRALAQVGVTLEEADYLDHWTRAGQGIADFCARFAPTANADALREYKARLYADLVQTDLNLMPGARQCLDALFRRKRLALATAGYLQAVNPALDHLGLRSYFPVIVAREDVRQFKPAPDVFLRAAELLKVAPENCVVLEDAEKGVLAAHAAGMACIAIPNRHTTDNDFSLATLVLPSLHDVTAAVIDAIIWPPKTA
jgi:beta-phosphoglucomutase